MSKGTESYYMEGPAVASNRPVVMRPQALCSPWAMLWMNLFLPALQSGDPTAVQRCSTLSHAQYGSWRATHSL